MQSRQPSQTDCRMRRIAALGLTQCEPQIVALGSFLHCYYSATSKYLKSCLNILQTALVNLPECQQAMRDLMSEGDGVATLESCGCKHAICGGKI